MSANHDKCNSAARLHTILSSAVKFGVGNKPTYEAWAKVFDIINAKEILREVYPKLAELGNLVDDLVRDISENISEDRRALYLRHIT